MTTRWVLRGIVLIGASALVASDWGSSLVSAQRQTGPRRSVIVSERHDRSPALRTLPRVPPPPVELREIPKHARPTRRANGRLRADLVPDPVVQRFTGTPLVPGAAQSFDGVGNVSNVLPSDANGDVGPNHFFQTVNVSLAIYSKGTASTPPSLLYGPFMGSTIWQGFGGPCETVNNGDPVVMYDHLADRWFMSQLALPNLLFGIVMGPFYQCIAVSTTPDPTGSYYRYQFSFDKLNDYPKFGVWPDAYYMTINQFTAISLQWAGQGVIAIDRARMLAGQPASMIYFDLSSTDPNLGGMLPADLDGRAPPSGSPGYFMQMDDDAWGYSPDRLQLWRFHVDWANPSASSFTGPVVLPTAPFDSDLCGNDPCVRQPGTTARLDALSDRLMFRLQYRNFGTHETLVLNHTVDTDGQDHAGIRWYEVRDPRTNPTIYQQGTYAPDADDRTVASAAMDRVGNLAIGFTASGVATYPSVRYTGRLATDAPGVLTQGEADLVAGGGSQTHTSGRWGDYSALLVDPSDGCTFWYTSQYYAATSEAAWRTRIGAFSFPSCTSAAGLPTVTVNATTSTANEAGPTSGRFTFSRTGNTASALTVRYTVDGLAAADVDYVALPDSVTIPAGASQTTLDVVPIDDVISEGDETVVLSLQADEEYSIGAPGGSMVTIKSDDAPPDLIVSMLTPPAVGGAGAPLTITEATKNQGTGVAGDSATGFYLSANGLLDASDVLMGARAVPQLAGGATDSAAAVMTVPSGTATGLYYVIAKADANGAVLETQEGNNFRTAQVRIGPDLVVSALVAPASAAAGATISVTDTTANNGGGAAGTSLTRYYLSSNFTVDSSDIVLGTRAVPALAASASSPGAVSLTVPTGTPGGVYYVIARADAGGDVLETFESNNDRQSGQVAVGADLYVPAITVPATAGAGGTIVITDTTTNKGAGATGASQTSFYLSANLVLDAADGLLGSRAVPALAAGASSSASTTVTILAATATGTWFVMVKADAGGVIAEGNEANNVGASMAIRVGPDLTVSALTAPAAAAPGSTITVSDTTTNSGSGTAGSSVTKFYLSANLALEASDTLVGSRAVPALSGGVPSTASTAVAIPAAIAGGTYYVIASADADNAVTETSEGNNARTSGQVKIGADLSVSLVVPATAGAGGPMVVSDTTRNVGLAQADPSSTGFYLSANSLLDAADVLLGARPVPSLVPNAADTVSTALQIPSGTAAGTYFVIAKADVGGVVAEGNETNNTYISSVRIGPDLNVWAFTGPSSAPAGSAITVTDTIKNLGGGMADASATRFYLSTNASFDASDTPLGARAVGTIDPGATDSGSTALTLPANLAPASYFLIAVADGDAQVPETNETNNWRTLVLNITAAP